MITSISAWPPNWAFTIALGIAIVAAAWIISEQQVRAQNRRAGMLREALLGSGMESNGDAFTVSGEGASVLVAGDRMAVLDLDEPRLVRTYSMFQVDALTIYDDKDHDAVDFHLNLRGGARSRRIRTRSMPEFCRLFDYLQKADKNVHFIAE